VNLSASLFAADPFRLEAQIAAVEPHGESLHVDIIDGRFPPPGVVGYGCLLASRVRAFASFGRIRALQP
jgi:pentose-5-phosphate-3-epimerase